MFCKKEWDYVFFMEAMTLTFVNGLWKKHREKILLETEKSKMPETQLILEKIFSIGEKKEAMKEIYKSINTLQYDIDIMNREIRSGKVERREFVKKCPVGNCRGFLSIKWKCGMCFSQVCSKCGEGKNEEHECNEDSIKSMELLKKDTKGCPRCGTMIHFIGGCSQMFCTQCHIAFDWKTGRIETGRIHNPHFYDWQRQNNNGVAPRVPGDNPEGCVENINNARGIYRVFSKELLKIHRFRGDLVYRIDRINKPDNRDLRMHYLSKKIDEDELKKIIQRRDKKFLKQDKLRDVAITFRDISNDILVEAYNHGKDSLNKSVFSEYENNLEELRQYINNCFEKVNNQFKSRACVHIDTQWNNISF
jgi:hypothetical protein